MLYPIVDPNEWAEKYNLSIETVTCPKCKQSYKRDVPFATKGYRGLMTKEHACGRMFISSIAVPTGESLKKLRDLLYA